MIPYTLPISDALKPVPVMMPPIVGLGGGYIRIGTEVDIKQGCLGTLYDDLLILFQCLVQIGYGIAHIRLNCSAYSE